MDIYVRVEVGSERGGDDSGVGVRNLRNRQQWRGGMGWLNRDSRDTCFIEPEQVQ